MSQTSAGLTILSNQTSYADSENIDSFERLRISDPFTIFSVQCQYNTATIKMESGTTGTGVAPSHSANTRLVTLSATAGTGTCFMQSYKYCPYQPGKSTLVKITGCFGTPVAAATMDYMYGDANNGIIYRMNGTSGVQIGLRTSTSGSASTNFVNQVNWNIDKLDGTGISGKTLDTTKDFILMIDLQFLGMGRVRVGFNIDGIIVPVHQFLCANLLTVPYMQSATLPIQILLTATATGSTANCYFKCAAVESEGGFSGAQGYTFSTPEGTVTANSGARTHLISIRPKTTFNSIVNRNFFTLDDIHMYVTGSNPVYWELCVGVTFSVAPTYADVNSTYSAFEYGTGGTYSGLTGLVISSGYLGPTTNQSGAVPISHITQQLYDISLDRSGAVRANGTLTLLVSGIGGTSAARGSLNYLEMR